MNFTLSTICDSTAVYSVYVDTDADDFPDLDSEFEQILSQAESAIHDMEAKLLQNPTALSSGGSPKSHDAVKAVIERPKYPCQNL